MLLVATHPEDRIGGAEVQASLIAQGLERAGDEVHYVAVESPPCLPVYAYERGIHLHRFDALQSRESRERALKGVLSEVDPDVCYCRLPHWLGSMRRASGGSRAKTVAHISSELDIAPMVGRIATPIWLRQFVQARPSVTVFLEELREVDLVIAQTRSQAQSLTRKTGLEAVVIPNCLPDMIRPRSLHERAGIIWVGNIKPVKRPEVFVQLAREMNARHLRHDMVMIGAPQHRRLPGKIDTWASRLNNLTYKGGLPFLDTWEAIAGSRILVNTSLAEGFSNTYVQAWLSGVAVVTVCCDPDGLIQREGLGVVARTTHRLPSVVASLMSDDEVLSEMQGRVRTYALSHHLYQSVIPRFVTALHGVVCGWA